MKYLKESGCQMAKRAVSIVLKRKLSKNVINWERIDENLITMNLNWIQRKIIIVGVCCI